MARQENKPSLNLADLRVLIVEDADFIRFLLCNLLKSFGIKHIETAVNGTAAIKCITEKARIAAGAPPYDLIFTDLLMDDVNGFMLLRWIRTSSASPDPFIPVVILSSAAEKKNIERARDLGATTFIGKPFTPDQVWQKLMGVFFRPRRFILGGGYFGPERRNLHLPHPDDQRAPRIDITLMRKKSRTVNFASPNVVHFEFPNMLAAMLGRYPIDGALPELGIEQKTEFDTSVASVREDYKVWFTKSITELRQNTAKLTQSGNNNQDTLFQLLKTADHSYTDASLFSYDLAAEIARSLAHTLAELSPPIEPKHITIITAYIDSLEAAFMRKLKDDGDMTTVKLLEQLREAAKRS